jgi:pimeloyl-ACP methyl ester carboxylesterase
VTYTNIGDINLAFDDTGSGPPVVLLHGYPFNRTIWDNQVVALSDNFRVITPDLRGFGESDSSDDATMSRMAQDIGRLMDALDLQGATIGGLSMGGYVVLSFYKQFPDRVRALVLADTRPQADTEEGKQTRIKQREQILREGMAATADAMLPKLLTPNTVSKRPELVKRIRDMIMGTKPEGAAAALMGMASREDQTELLPKIAVPTLIVVGRDDPITPVQDSQLMHEHITASELLIAENASHVSNLEQPELFNASLRSFLANLN